MKKSTRLFGALLALVFVFALFPVSAFAAEPDAVQTELAAETEPAPQPETEPAPQPETEPADKPEFAAETNAAGKLKNVKGMEYRVGETGDYTKVPEEKSEVDVNLNHKDPSFTIFVRTGEGAEPIKVEVGRMPEPETYFKEVVPPTTKGGNDGQIILTQKVKLEFGNSLDKLQPINEKEIIGLEPGIYYIYTAPEGSNLGSTSTLAISVPDYDPVTVSFEHGDHGEGTMDSVTMQKGTKYKLPECTFTPVNTDKAKYEFDGWKANSNVTANENGEYEMLGDTVFTAQWKEIPVEPEKPVMKDITLTYDYNDGSGKGSSETKTVEEGNSAEFVLPEAPYQRDEHEFEGWEIAGKVYKAGETVYNTMDAAAKAVWKEREPLHYVLRFDPNGGTGAPEAQDMGMSKRREVRLTVTDQVPTKEGMKFLGWSLHKGTEVVLQPGDVCLLNEKFPDLTVYAVWVDPAAAPKTGDESNAALWASIAAVSLIVIAGAVFFILKKNKKDAEGIQDDQIDNADENDHNDQI